MNIHKEPEQIVAENARLLECVRNYRDARRTGDPALIELAVTWFQSEMLDSAGWEMNYMEALNELEDFRLHGMPLNLHEAKAI